MKIAVIIDDEDAHRQSEALRVALGLTLCDDIVDVFILDKDLKLSEAANKNLALLTETSGAIYTNNERNNFSRLTTEEIGRKLAGYDIIVPY